MHKNIIYPSGEKTIEISFDPKEIDDYLSLHGPIKIEHSNYAKRVFLKAIKDFLNMKIDSELLSGVANRIYYIDKFRYPLEFDPDLDQLLDHISELEYNLAIKDKSTVAKHLSEMEEYFAKNKKTEGESSLSVVKIG
jgi:hypothetical protein